MKCSILHQSAGRMRVHLHGGRMTLDRADVLEYYLLNIPGITSVKVYDRTGDAIIRYTCPRSQVIHALSCFHYEDPKAIALVPDHTGRALNREYEDKLVMRVVRRCASKLFLPVPIRTVITVFKSVHYIYEGLRTLAKGKLEVPVLDATAITVSMLRGDFATASSVMFLLGIGEILEEWTHKKSVDDLARTMSLNVDKVSDPPQRSRGSASCSGCGEGRRNRGSYRRHDSPGRHRHRRRSNRQPGFHHRRIHARSEIPGQLCLCRNRGGGRRMHHPGGQDLR